MLQPEGVSGRSRRTDREDLGAREMPDAAPVSAGRNDRFQLVEKLGEIDAGEVVLRPLDRDLVVGQQVVRDPDADGGAGGSRRPLLVAHSMRLAAIAGESLPGHPDRPPVEDVGQNRVVLAVIPHASLRAAS